jgi:aerobic carbon-monoxide dehydrogenase small subunit
MRVNGQGLNIEVGGDDLLCHVLRESLGLTGTRVGCGEGVCGSCNILVDGMVVRSCLMLAAQADGCEVRTVEGLASGGRLSRLQRSFIEHGAVQCGFCTAGLLITATALLESNQNPTDAEVTAALAGNLCRCTGYAKIMTAVRAATEPEA